MEVKYISIKFIELFEILEWSLERWDFIAIVIEQFS